jgi:hypothetical protein
MNKFISAAIITGFTVFTSPAALAVMPMPYPGVSLNRVTLQLSAEQWATTTSARVIVSIDAAVKETQLNKLRTDILAKLDHLAPKAEWNITRFERTEATSGLAQIRVDAETRVPEASLGALNEKAKSLSKPGETYRVAAIDFSPSLPELEKIRGDLRNKILNDVKTELDRLNTAYPDQKYSLHDIQFNENFVSGPVALLAAPTAAMEKTATGGAADTTAKTTSLAVSNKITINAVVTLASVIKPAT